MKKVHASAPGSLMIVGEHAVLYGHSAIAMAINKRLCVTIAERKDDHVLIESDVFGLIPISHPNARFVAHLYTYFQQYLPHGLNIKITSTIPYTVGFGSSASLVAALTAAFYFFVYNNINHNDIFKIGFECIKAVQGKGSGSDLAASIFGGFIRKTALSHKKIPGFLHLWAIYSGSKTPTIDVINHVHPYQERHPQTFKHLFKASDSLVRQTIKDLKNNDLKHLGSVFNVHQGLHVAYQTSNAALEGILDALKKEPGILGAKISGAGLGDCVIALGNLQQENFSAYQIFEIETDKNGLL